MQKAIRSVLSIAVVLALSAVPSFAATWEQILAGATTVSVNGEERAIAPSCALGQPYSFFFKQGKSDKLVIFFNGGGACWNSQTCYPASGAYTPVIDQQHNNPAALGGLFDADNPSNPYRDWSILFLSYCTGDVHFGSHDKAYPGLPLSIRHRGFDNFLYALDWARKHFSLAGNPSATSVGKVLVTGSSAGSYGAALDFPYIKSAFPGAKGYLLSDAGSGVFTDDFLGTAIQSADSAWGIAPNIPSWVPGMESVTFANANTLVGAIYSSIAGYYPKDKFSQYTTAWDAAQVLFYNIMDNSTDPTQWGQLTPEDFGYWAGSMHYSTGLMGASLPNYRYYVAPGCNHTILDQSADFFSEDGVNGVSFRAWLQGMTDGKNKTDWQNLEYVDAPPTSAEVGACLQRAVLQ